MSYLDCMWWGLELMDDRARLDQQGSRWWYGSVAVANKLLRRRMEGWQGKRRAKGKEGITRWRGNKRDSGPTRSSARTVFSLLFSFPPHEV